MSLNVVHAQCILLPGLGEQLSKQVFYASYSGEHVYAKMDIILS